MRGGSDRCVRAPQQIFPFPNRGGTPEATGLLVHVRLEIAPVTGHQRRKDSSPGLLCAHPDPRERVRKRLPTWGKGTPTSDFL